MVHMQHRPGPHHYAPDTALGRFLGGVFGALVATFLGSVVACMILAGLAAGLWWVAAHIGLVGLWASFVHLSTVSSSWYALFEESVLFGLAAGFVIGILQFYRRWRGQHHRWVVEALISPEALGALRYGVAALILHMLISGLIAAALSWTGVHFSLPADLGGHGAGIAISNPNFLYDLYAAGGGGGGAGGGWDPSHFWFDALLVIFAACFFIAVIVCLLYAALACFLTISVTAKASVAGQALVRGAVFGTTVALTGALMELAMRRRDDQQRYFEEKQRNSLKSYTKETQAQALQDLISRFGNNFPYIDWERWFLQPGLTGAITGALNAGLYLAVIFLGAAIFGIQIVAH